MLCFSRDGSGRNDVLFFSFERELCLCVSVFLWKGICVSFSFVFLCSFFFFLGSDSRNHVRKMSLQEFVREWRSN